MNFVSKILNWRVNYANIDNNDIMLPLSLVLGLHGLHEDLGFRTFPMFVTLSSTVSTITGIFNTLYLKTSMIFSFNSTK